MKKVKETNPTFRAILARNPARTNGKSPSPLNQNMGTASPCVYLPERKPTHGDGE